jgi:hypothetical protein
MKFLGVLYGFELGDSVEVKLAVVAAGYARKNI